MRGRDPAMRWQNRTSGEFPLVRSLKSNDARRRWTRAGLFLGHLDRDLRTIALREPGLVLQSRRHAAVADFVRVAEFVEIEQLGRQRLAAGVSLALVLIDAHLQSRGFRHSTNSVVARAPATLRASIRRDGAFA